MANLTLFLEWLLSEKEYLKYDIDHVLHEPKRKKIPHEKLNLYKNEGVHNILAVLKKATKEEIDYWSNWYQHAHGHVRELSELYDVPLEVAAGVAAVLSPNLGWKVNLLAAKRTMDNWMHLGGAEDYPFWTNNPAYKTNVNKAMKILETGNLDLVKGPKVTVFYHSLLNPDRVERELVLDGHAINVWRGVKTPLKNLKQPTKEERKAIIQDYKKVADLTGLTPQQLQAVTWFVWKAVSSPPTVSGNVPVEQPEIKEARRRLLPMIKETVRKQLDEYSRREIFRREVKINKR